MVRSGEELYRTWIELYDKGVPDEAMELTAPDLVMLTPDGRQLNRAEALEFTGQIKAFVHQMGIARRTHLVSIHVVPMGEGYTSIHATVDLVFTKPLGEETRHRFVEVMHVGPAGIFFDAFSKLSESHDIF